MKKRKNPFTLVELLIAVGLLSLIMMLLLQLFSGTQKIWIASEKTGNVHADARVAMELMADLIGTVQFSHGEKEEKVENSDDVRIVRDTDQDMIFSLDTSSKTDGRDSSGIIFVSKTARDLPMNNNPTRFVSFRYREVKKDGALNNGQLLMVVYSDEKSDFYDFFPTYGSAGGKRDTALTKLKGQMNALTPGTDDNGGEKNECQVIAENVVSFKLTAYTLVSSSTTGENPETFSKLEKKADAADIADPPQMIEIRLTLLDRDSFKRWQELPDTKQQGETQSPRDKYLDQHQRTFTRNVFIGDRWALEAQTKSGSGN